ncbi:chorismate mutase [Roseibium sp. MMSF_3412]|uniref:chorismate mutase n=1 Tax=Roseibium sp. MMSF_3412 TaxID=3046712 RepID=UPI00273F5429|nr:chorismate mutase [Roseibium sp. MMSF_3412]
MKTPDECLTKQDIRIEIDRLDGELVRLFAERQTYVRRMADLKQHPDEAFDGTRIESMISAIRDRAGDLALDPEQAELVWRTLIDWNIAFEKKVISERLRGDVVGSDTTPD